jgi:pimeloyl-ACP methyl ester carboxylesterase
MADSPLYHVDSGDDRGPLIGTHIFEAVGHMVHLEAPHETARLILDGAAAE